MLLYSHDTAPELLMLCTINTIDWDAKLVGIGVMLTDRYMYHDWNTGIVTGLTAVTLHDSVLQSISLVYLPDNNRETLADCQVDFAEYRREVRQDENRGRLQELERCMSAERDNEPLLTVPEKRLVVITKERHES